MLWSNAPYHAAEPVEQGATMRDRRFVSDRFWTFPVTAVWWKRIRISRPVYCAFKLRDSSATCGIIPRSLELARKLTFSEQQLQRCRKAFGQVRIADFFGPPLDISLARQVMPQHIGRKAC